MFESLIDAIRREQEDEKREAALAKLREVTTAAKGVIGAARPREPRGGWFAGPPTEAGPPVSPEERITELGPSGAAEYRPPQKNLLTWLFDQEWEFTQPVEDWVKTHFVSPRPGAGFVGPGPGVLAGRPLTEKEQAEQARLAGLTAHVAALPSNILPIVGFGREILAGGRALLRAGPRRAALATKAAKVAPAQVPTTEIAVAAPETVAAPTSRYPLEPVPRPGPAGRPAAGAEVTRVQHGPLTADEAERMYLLQQVQRDRQLTEPGQRVLEEYHVRAGVGAPEPGTRIPQEVYRPEVSMETRTVTEVPPLSAVEAAGPTVAGYQGRAQAAKRFYDEVRRRASELRVRFAREAERRAEEGVVQARRGELSAGEVTRVEEQINGAREQYVAAARDARDARIKASTDDFVERATAAGADEGTVAILKQGYENALQLAPQTEPLLTAPVMAQRMARIAASIEGTVPGVVGKLAQTREMIYSALRQGTSARLTRIGKDLDRALAREAPNLTYVGPGGGIREIATNPLYQARIMVQHPRWWQGMSDDLLKLLGDVQEIQGAKLKAAQELGYPIKALEKPYLEQVWELEHSALETMVGRIPGRVSIARDRIFGDYVQGIAAGFTPRDMTVAELIEHSSRLMDQATSDAWMRREILQRFGTRKPAGVATGSRRFGHPLYSTHYGPGPIVNFVDQLYTPAGPFVRSARNFAAPWRNVLFGIADIGVFGVHLSLAVATSGPRILMGMINRSLRLAHLPYLHLYLSDSRNMPHVIQATLSGVQQGIGPSAVRLGAGTPLKWVPRIGEVVDQPVAALIDTSARAQFGALLTPIRNMLYEGNLIVLHMTGEDITKAATRLTAGDNANAFTGASRGAMLPGRAAAEEAGLISYQMTRAEGARLLQVAKGAFSPTASSAERALALITLASFGAMVYGVGSAINISFGNGPIEFDPRKGDWATIKAGGLTVPLIPQRAVIRALSKSFEALREWDPADLGRIWAQAVGGKLGPIAQPLPAIAGFGWDPDVGYRAGDLTGKGRILNIAPLPPIVEQILTRPGERTPLGMGLTFTGFNVWEIPVAQRAEKAGAALKNKPAARIYLGIDPESWDLLRLDEPVDEWSSIEWAVVTALDPSLREALDEQVDAPASAGLAWAQRSREKRFVMERFAEAAEMILMEEGDATETAHRLSELREQFHISMGDVDNLEKNPQYREAVERDEERVSEQTGRLQLILRERRAILNNLEPGMDPGDRRRVFEELDAYDATLSDPEQRLLEAYSGLSFNPSDYPAFAERREDRRALSEPPAPDMPGWWDIEEFYWAEIAPNKAPLDVVFEGEADRLRRQNPGQDITRDEVHRQLLWGTGDLSEKYNKYVDNIQAVKYNYRMDYPGKEAMAYKLGNITKVLNPDAAYIYHEWTGRWPDDFEQAPWWLKGKIYQRPKGEE